MTLDWPNHADAWRVWREAMGGTRMHHGWILAGKAGLGKHDFAEAAARELIGASPDVEQHPDILVLTYGPKDEKEERKRAEGKDWERARSIRIGQIREMQHRLTTRPTLGDKRVVIINPADDMERNASNALLKSLEEPPQGTYFLLVTHRPSRLLPTIRSRCRILRFPLLADEQIALMLDERMPGASGTARDAALAAAAGSIGAAIAFIEQELGPLAQLMQEIVSKGDPTLELRARFAKAVGPRPDRPRMQAVFDLARAIVTRSTIDASPERQKALIDVHSELVTLSGQAPTYNFDAGLLVLEIGTLLARPAEASERADA